MKEPSVMLVARELTREDLLEIFIELAQNLTHQRNEAVKELNSWKGHAEMYRRAWARELDDRLIHKSHEIDALVLTTRYRMKQARQWEAHENGLVNRDPFWMVPEPASDLQIVQTSE